MKHRLLIILGRGRSGTTLLGKLLSNHDTVHVAPEAIFLLNLARRFRNKRFTPTTVRTFVKELFLEARIRNNWRLTEDSVLASLLASPPANYSDACLRIYSLEAMANGKGESLAWVGDKNPLYSLFPRQLIKLFPAAKFLVLTRNAKDNVASFMKVSFDSNHPLVLAWRWVIYQRTLLRFVREVPARVCHIRYEDLVAAEASEVWSRLSAFLGESLDPATTPSSGAQRNSAAGKPQHANLERPVMVGHVNTWHAAFDPSVATEIDEIASSTEKRWGYLTQGESRSRVGGWPKSVAVFWALVERGFFFLPFRLRMSVLNRRRS